MSITMKVAGRKMLRFSSNYRFDPSSWESVANEEMWQARWLMYTFGLQSIFNVVEVACGTFHLESSGGMVIIKIVFMSNHFVWGIVLIVTKA